MQNTPYTYLIGWSSHRKYYYGVRWSKSANPKDLWRTYFTSSRVVKAFRTMHGEPDIVEVRKTFNNNREAQLWEERVLTRMKVGSKEEWLNLMERQGNSSVIHKKSMRGITNDHRILLGMKPLPGKTIGATSCDGAKMNMSESSRQYTMIRNKETDVVERVLKDVGRQLISNGTHLPHMLGKSRKGHSVEARLKQSEAAKNQPVYHCVICGVDIKNTPNWNKHLISNKHKSHI